MAFFGTGRQVELLGDERRGKVALLIIPCAPSCSWAMLLISVNAIGGWGRGKKREKKRFTNS